jgi:hypothetical protein
MKAHWCGKGDNIIQFICIRSAAYIAKTHSHSIQICNCIHLKYGNTQEHALSSQVRQICCTKNQHQLRHPILAAVLRITIKEGPYYSNKTELKESENLWYASKVVLTQREELFDKDYTIYTVTFILAWKWPYHSKMDKQTFTKQ